MVSRRPTCARHESSSGRWCDSATWSPDSLWRCGIPTGGRRCGADCGAVIVHPRLMLGKVASRWFGERRLPIGGTSRDRRLLREVLNSAEAGRVLVVGPSLAARQALAKHPVDVAGTNPFLNEVN